MVVLNSRSCTNTSLVLLVSGSVSAAPELKRTNRPLALMVGPPAPLLAWVPSVPTGTRVVVPVSRSWTKTSFRAFVSPGTNVDPRDW